MYITGLGKGVVNMRDILYKNGVWLMTGSGGGSVKVSGDFLMEEYN